MDSWRTGPDRPKSTSLPHREKKLLWHKEREVLYSGAEKLRKEGPSGLSGTDKVLAGSQIYAILAQTVFATVNVKWYTW